MAESATPVPSVSREDEALAVVVEGIISAAELLQEDDIGTTGEARPRSTQDREPRRGARRGGLSHTAPWGQSFGSPE